MILVLGLTVTWLWFDRYVCDLATLRCDPSLWPDTHYTWLLAVTLVLTALWFWLYAWLWPISCGIVSDCDPAVAYYVWLCVTHMWLCRDLTVKTDGHISLACLCLAVVPLSIVPPVTLWLWLLTVTLMWSICDRFLWPLWQTGTPAVCPCPC